MRAALVAIVCFAGLLALGHYVAAPFFCRGDFSVPTLDARLLCGADFHLSRSGSVLLYFTSVSVAFFFGVMASFLPEKKQPETKQEAKPIETFEQVVASSEKKDAPAKSPETKPAETKTADAKKNETAAAAGKQPEPKPAIGDAIMAGLAAKKGGAVKGFEGTKEELLERFRELKKQEGVNSVAQAQRLLDESTLSALQKGTDPKTHLSEIAHLVLAEDPDLKSGVVRGVVVHIAARLKELGVANKLPNPAKPAA